MDVKDVVIIYLFTMCMLSIKKQLFPKVLYVYYSKVFAIEHRSTHSAFLQAFKMTYHALKEVHSAEA